MKVDVSSSLQIIIHIQICFLKQVLKKIVFFQVSSSTLDGHSTTLRYQRIVCFACPACFLFFNLRDECLQHMSAKNHFTVSLPMAGKR